MERAAVTHPRVTVLMAVYNGERHLRESVESILGQTHTDFELLVIDDGSTDSSREILDSYADNRIRVLTNDRNVGLTGSLNRGLEEARGDLIARQDADDVSEPQRLARQVAYLDDTPSTALVASDYVRIDDDGQGMGERVVPKTATAIRWRLLFLNAFTHSSITMRTEVSRQLGGYDPRYAYAQDYDLWSRFADRHQVHALSDSLVRYRRSRESMTADQRKEGTVDEVDLISRRNLERLRPGCAEGFDREAAWRLLFADYRVLEARRALSVSKRLLAIARAFARYYELPLTAALAHYASLGVVVTRRLAALGVHHAPLP
jgi:glycosyltransferase involved in cell wall biosynthesis